MLEEYKNRTNWENNTDEINLRSDVLVSERIISLYKNITDKKILDIGCGNGKFTRKLNPNNEIKAIDMTLEQVNLCKSLDNTIDYHLADITDTTTYTNKLAQKNFNLIFSLLVHIYIEPNDVSQSFKNIENLLTDDGEFVLALSHPCRDCNKEGFNYFENVKLTETYPTNTDEEFVTSFYLHPISFISEKLKDAGLIIKEIFEPKPTKEELRKYGHFFNSNEENTPAYIIFIINKKEV